MKNALEEGGKGRMREIKSGPAREAESEPEITYFLKASPGGKGPGHGSKQKGSSAFLYRFLLTALREGSGRGRGRQIWSHD